MQGKVVAQDALAPGTSCVPHPSNNAFLIALQPGHIHLLDWSSLKRISPLEGIPIVTTEPFPETNDSPWTGRLNSHYVARASTSSDKTSLVSAIRVADLTSETTELPPQTKRLQSLTIDAVLGVLRSSLYFLDTAGWVCSISLKNLAGTTHFTRHFFIPPTWRTGINVVIRILSKTVVDFVRDDQLNVFHGFVEFEEVVAVE